MRAALVVAVLVLGCCGCAAPHAATDAGDTGYLYKGDITRDGGTTCWWYCP